MTNNKKEPTIIEKELLSRKDGVRDELMRLFETNMKITDWDVSEPDDNEAALMLIKIFEEKINELKQDVLSGKYNNGA